MLVLYMFRGILCSVPSILFSKLYLNSSYLNTKPLQCIRLFAAMPPKRKVATAKTDLSKGINSKEAETDATESSSSKIASKRNKKNEASETKATSKQPARNKNKPEDVPKDISKRAKRQPEKVSKLEEEKSDESEEEREELVLKNQRGIRAIESDDSEEEIVPKKNQRGTRVKHSGDSEEERDKIVSKKNQKGTRSKQSDDSEEEEREETVPKKNQRTTRTKQETNAKTLLNQTETSYANISFVCNKPNKLGKTTNFCVSSWNVDGLRAWLKKGGLTYCEYEKPDIFCIQESKCSTEKLPPEIKNLAGYKQYWHNSTKEGYAGVGLFTRSEPISVEYGIGIETHDEEGRCITAEFDKFYVVSVYVPNAGRKLVTLPKRLEWNIDFKEFIKNLDKKKPVIICGDMNVAHDEIDLANPKTNSKNAGFSKEERDGMTDFLEDGYIDTFRSFYPDKKGAYTFWTYMGKSRAKNVGWRLDYFIVSERLFDNVCDNIIRNEVFGSDHCPIVLFLNF